MNISHISNEQKLQEFAEKIKEDVIDKKVQKMMKIDQDSKEFFKQRFQYFNRIDCII